MIYVSVVRCGLTVCKMHGPFVSIDEAKKKITDSVKSSLYGERYTFFRVVNGVMKEEGYVLIRDDSIGKNKRVEKFNAKLWIV